MIIGHPSVSASVQASFPKRSPTSFATAYPVHFVHPALYFARSETVFLMSGGTEAISEVQVGDHILTTSRAGKSVLSEVSTNEQFDLAAIS